MGHILFWATFNLLKCNASCHINVILETMISHWYRIKCKILLRTECVPFPPLSHYYLNWPYSLCLAVKPFLYNDSNLNLNRNIFDWKNIHCLLLTAIFVQINISTLPKSHYKFITGILPFFADNFLLCIVLVSSCCYRALYKIKVNINILPLTAFDPSIHQYFYWTFFTNSRLTCPNQQVSQYA